MLTGKQCLQLIQAHASTAAERAKKWNKYRAWYQGKFWDEKLGEAKAIGPETGDSIFETSYAYAWIDTMTANVVAANPQVTVNARDEANAPAAEAREALGNEALRRGKGHERLWQLATGSALDGVQFMKTVWSQRLQRPIFRVLSPRVLWFDETAEAWEDIRYAIEVVPMTEEDFKRKSTPQQQADGTMSEPLYNQALAQRAHFGGRPSFATFPNQQQKELDAAFRWIVVYEFYDFTGDGAVSHYIGGVDEPLLGPAPLPYKFVRNPYMPLVFNNNMQDLMGLSDIQLIESAQEVLNELNALEVRHAEASIPVMILDGGQLEDAEGFLAALQKINGPGQGVVANRTMQNPVPLDDLFTFTRMPSLSPAWSGMKEEARHAIEYVLALPSYARGVTGVTDVATEVALADTATRTRNGRRQRAVYTVQQWMSEAAIGLYEEFLAPDTTIPVRLTGDEGSLVLNRQLLGYGDRKLADNEGLLDYDYEAVPFSAAEQNRLVQLRSLRENWNSLMEGAQAGHYDVRKIFSKLADAMLATDIMSKVAPEGGAAPPPPPGGNIPAPDGNLPAPGEDTMVGGGLPDGVEPAAEFAVNGAGAGSGTKVLNGDPAMI